MADMRVNLRVAGVNSRLGNISFSDRGFPKRSLKLAVSREGFQPGVSVVVPVYNEESNVTTLVKEVTGVMSGLGMSWELIVVDDGSLDGTFEILKQLKSDRVRVLRLRKNKGQSTAMAVGFASVRYAYTVTMDGDLQNDPADIPKLLGLLERFHAVFGVRAQRHDNVWRKLVSRFANRIRRTITGDKATDTGCSLKAFRSEILAGLMEFRGMHRFIPALLEMRGCEVTEVEVGHRPRLSGTSKYGTFDRLRKTLPDLLAVRWMQERLIDYDAWEV